MVIHISRNNAAQIIFLETKCIRELVAESFGNPFRVSVSNKERTAEVVQGAMQLLFQKTPSAHTVFVDTRKGQRNS